MRSHNVTSGRQGEDFAAQYLAREGYQVLARNYRTRHGEIDIVAKDGPTICFVEVKARSSQAKGSPEEAVSLTKRRRISCAAVSFMQKKENLGAAARFDVVSLLMQEGGNWQPTLYKNAFEMDPRYNY